MSLVAQTSSAPKSDPLGRENPRSAVTGFLEACRDRDYQRAAQYLDLRHFSADNQTHKGPVLARDLEAILNSDPRFNVLELSRNAEGNLSDDADPSREHVAAVTQAARLSRWTWSVSPCRPDRRQSGCSPPIRWWQSQS